MWLSSKMNRDTPASPVAMPARITISENGLAALSHAELRGLHILAPGGVRWRPRIDDQVLVLKQDDQNACVAGILAEPDNSLLPGEIRLAAGNASIRILPDGTIALAGQITVNGKEIT